MAEVLEPAQFRLWCRMSGPDRRHAVRCGRYVLGRLGEDAPREVVQAAIMHDVGKLDSRLRTYGRVVATLCGALAGRKTAHLWVRGSGFTRRVGLYLLHPELGADMLALAGSHDLVVRWAREHHLPESQWTVDTAVGRILREADSS